MLAHALVKRFSAEQNRGTMTLAEDAVRAIERHRWAGNVRELENCIKRAVIMADGNVVTGADIGLLTPSDDESDLDLRKIREEAEKRAVISALSRANGNVVRAAELLAISRPTLYDLMHRFGLK